MLEKNIKKQERKNRRTWVGYYNRVTPTKNEKLRKIEKKSKQKGYKDVDSCSLFLFYNF